MQTVKTFFLIISIAVGTIGGCGGTDGDSAGTTEVSGDLLVFETGIPPGFPIFVRTCLDLIADDGTVYELVVTPPGVRLQSGMRITGLLMVIGRGGLFDFEECGADKAAELIEVFEKTCVREGGIEDICLTPDAGCCPVEGCEPTRDDCPIPSCPSDQKPCGPFCIDIDATCCPDPDFVGESCPPNLPACCPRCGQNEIGLSCVETIDDCSCRPRPPDFGPQ